MLEVEIEPLSLDRFVPVVGPEVHRRLAESMRGAVACLGPRTVWSINSTALEGRVARYLGGVTDVPGTSRISPERSVTHLPKSTCAPGGPVTQNGNYPLDGCTDT